jgi:hypothetical protein
VGAGDVKAAARGDILGALRRPRRRPVPLRRESR